MTQSEGVFEDNAVTGGHWRGKVRRVRVFLYRRRTVNDSEPIDPVTEINQVSDRFITQMSATGIGIRRCDDHDLYAWLLRWFNPKADVSQGDLDKLCELMSLTTGMVILLLGVGSAQAFDAPSTTLSTPEIMASLTPDPSCLNYCVTGVCVWLKCSLTGCRIRTSPRVSHYNPDLVVSVYDQPGNNPWAEAEWLISHWEKQMANVLVGLFHGTDAGGGHRTEGGNTSTDQSLRFKEATAIGHPLSSLSQAGGQTGLFCPSEATAFVPYFSSSFDSLTWRLGLPEMLYLHNLLPGRRVVGAGIWQQWGSVWPRTGFINQKDDAKAAAVVAQRVGNIVTQSHQPHVYVPLQGNGFNDRLRPG